MGCGCGSTHAQGWQGAGTQRRVPDFSSRYRGLRDAPGTGWVPTAHGPKAAVRSVHGSQPCVAGGRRSEGKSSPAETDAIPSEVNSFSPGLEPTLHISNHNAYQTPLPKPDSALPFCSHIPSQGRFRGGALPTTGLSVTRKKDEQGETVTSPKPTANAVPGRPGQVRQKGVRWCRSRRAGVPRCPGPAARQAEQRGELRTCPALPGQAGPAPPPPGPPARRADGEGDTPGQPEGPGQCTPGNGGLAQRAGPGSGSASAAPSRQGPSGAGRGWVRGRSLGRNSSRRLRQQSELAEESSHRKAFLPANGSTAGPPHALGWPGPRFLRQGPPGRREVGKGRPPEQARARGDRDRGGDGVKTSCRRLEGRSTAGCAPPVPDSLELPPAAAPARTAGSHRRVSALRKPSQMPHRRSPVPSGCRLCRGGSGSPLGQAALPVPAPPLAVSRLARSSLAGARQGSGGKADAGRAPRLPERRSRPGATRGSAQLLPGKPRQGSPVEKSRWNRPARPGREQEAAAPLLAEPRQGHPWGSERREHKKRFSGPEAAWKAPAEGRCLCGERRRLSGQAGGCRTAPHRAARPALPCRGETLPSSRTPPVGPGRCRGERRARTRRFKQGERAAPRSTAPRRSCPRENAARIPRRRPRHPARELPGAKEGSGGERAAVGAGGGGWGRRKACRGNSAAAHPGRPRRLPRAGPRRLPPPRSGGGARRAGRGRGQRGDSGRAPIRGGPSRALPGAVCRWPPGLRREPIRGRLPARGAEGTQERRGRRSLPP
ncbi:collagen alpha-1(III) chain-like [Ammospiza caudacuta]|uniref:collagen alpha-1(III) chain-like n=1 Tax=Ammospiza caudacuta TaxID=2857398 RepID=UPI0027391855|nr:collagen alpha-1(III) chain-like [Ammospiza caudacuta]